MPHGAGGWALERGATMRREAGGVHFAVWAPRAAHLSVVLKSGAAAGEHALIALPESNGVYEGFVPAAAAGDDYCFRFDDGRERPDPVSRWQPHGVHGPSRIVDPLAFSWRDDAWHGIEMADVVLYEMHVGAYTAIGTFDGAIPHLRWLRELGVTAIELMPVNQFPGARNWGYDGVDAYAPHHDYGGPDGLRRLVDAAHREGLAIFLDVVYNHLGPEGNYLAEYAPYGTDQYRTAWGETLNFDGPDSDEVRRFVVDNALYWVTEYHIDGLRLDAADHLYDLSPNHLLVEIATAVHAAGRASGRRVLVTAETDLNDPRLLRPPAQGGYGFDAQWADDFHHAVHTAVTPERSGYYRDYDGVASLAHAYEHAYVYDGRYSPFRRRRRGAPSTGISSDHFVVFIQNHDQVGNRNGSDRLSELTSFALLKLATAALLLSPFVPLLFMGEEYGETNRFHYFVSHSDPQLIEAVHRGRTAEFAHFAWDRPIADPSSEETLRHSRLDRSVVEASPHRELLALYRDLLALRRSEPALRPGDATVQVAHDADAGWIRLTLTPRRVAPGTARRALVVLLNFADDDRQLSLPASGTWRHRLSTDDARYGGHGELDDDAPRAGGSDVVVPSHAALLLGEVEA